MKRHAVDLEMNSLKRGNLSFKLCFKKIVAVETNKNAASTHFFPTFSLFCTTCPCSWNTSSTKGQTVDGKRG
jgi:hypothetical protein